MCAVGIVAGALSLFVAVLGFWPLTADDEAKMHAALRRGTSLSGIERMNYQYIAFCRLLRYPALGGVAVGGFLTVGCLIGG